VDDDKREALFLRMVWQYALLFWIFLLGFAVLGGWAAFGHIGRYQRAISAILAIACAYGAMSAPRGPWTRWSKRGIPGLGSEEVESVDPLAGDRSPDASTTKVRAPPEAVRLVEPEEPEPPEGSAPPRE
jgi:hypothetical protein